MTQTTRLENCPFCGAKLPESNFNESLLENLDRLKQEGVLEHTLIVAINVVKTMNDNNPAWLRELFKDHLGEVKGSLAKYIDNDNREAREIMDEIKKAQQNIIGKIIEVLGNPQIMGKAQELSIAKRLSAMKIGNDTFSVSKSTKAQEDIECVVIEKNTPYGKVLIESKKTKKWSSEYLTQLLGYMKNQSTEFGILATQTLPDDALNDTVWKDSVLIVKPENIEPAYVYLRQFLIMKKELQMMYDQKMSMLEVKDMVVQELQTSIRSGELDALIKRINESTDKIDDELVKAEKYMSRHIRALRLETKRIRECTTDLMSNHVEKIRMQLMEQINEIYYPIIEA